MAKFNEGDVVKIISREPTPADVKNQTYYPYFAGLSGTVDKVYDNEICVRVDPEALPADVLKRHTEIQESIKHKWLNGLSGEARNRLTPEEKQFKLAYTILVQAGDLEKIKPGPKPSKKETPEPVRIEKVQPVKAEKAPPTPKAAKAEKPPAEETDLTPEELAFLKEREQALKKRE